jgi:AsmA-like C-terminal region
MRKRSILVAVLLSVFLLLLAGLYAARPAIASFVRHRTERILEEQFSSRVEFADFWAAFTPDLHVTVKQLILRYHGRKDIPPLIQIAELSMTLRLLNVVRLRPHVAAVHLGGLQITIPPREPGSPPTLDGIGANLKFKYPVVIDLLQANDAKITLVGQQSGKSSLEFSLHHLQLTDVSSEHPARFTASLTNAVPKGEIEVSGVFGPWNVETPRTTLLQAEYRLEHADLATINGLQGILSSAGSFSGPLDYLAIKGTTDTPDFTLRSVGNPIALHTDFVAAVDGTNGNTYLQRVVARFLHSTLVATGEVVDLDREIASRTIDLEASSDNARVEDLIRLAVKTEEAVLTGRTRLKAKIHIAEADVDLGERLEVTSEFRIDNGQFTNPALQEKVDSLSRKGQGQPKNNEIAHVNSQLNGAMHLEKGAIHFSGLRFLVPGASIELHGTYTLAGGALDFHGNLFLDAKLSQTATGAKAFLLKAIDPFFTTNGSGTKLPIRILGTSEHAQFALDRGGKDADPPSATQTRSNPTASKDDR